MSRITIGAPDRGEPVRDDETWCGRRANRPWSLNQLLALRCRGYWSFVHEDLRRRQNRASDGEPLLLAPDSLPARRSTSVALWQADDELASRWRAAPQSSISGVGRIVAGMP